MSKRIYVLVVLSAFGLLSVIVLNLVFLADDKPTLSPEEFFNVAHRGASGLAPELTRPAFELAIERGADYIELDLQTTKDGALVLMHDETVDRTTDGTGKVSDLTLDQIKELDAGSWFNEKFPDKADPDFEGLEVLTLNEAIEEFADDIRLYIEIKAPIAEPGLEEKLLATLEVHGLIGEDVPRGTVLIQSFYSEALYNIYVRNQRVALFQLVSDVNPSGSDYRLENISEYAVGVGVNYHDINEEFVDKALEKGLLVHPYTANDPDVMEQLIEWGATGVITDYPGRLSEVTEEMGLD
ncbi:glycerophosphodiester phosphodiesterase family protein [Indiicoccus explosivorum]|uniref:glycerophosphodiester phosphodiesterase family protein n=1 Tax=Indiicoccus explosivorum TaxID=1917864 RepID=UPI0013906C79|nr:glycerophosphodiester phosphodiesterase family protein [Indiicoccus explosivorum]